MTGHTELLNYIAKKINAKSYLEIGLLNAANNFNKIMAEEKTSVDPDPKAKARFVLTSDKFFAANWIKLEDEEHERPILTFDLAFIDGLHHADQVKRDIINTWKCLNIGGIILLHDCNPPSEHITHEPRDNKIWCGGVYKTACAIFAEKFTIDVDYGCMILRKQTDKDIRITEPVMGWEVFDENRKELLNLVSIEDGLKIIDSWT